MYSYSRQARFTGSPESLSKGMKEAVDSLIEARVKIRRVHEALSSLASDASGTAFTDNYDDPDIRKVAKSLYELDHTIGDAFQGIEKLDRDLKKKVKTAKAVEAPRSIKKGEELIITMRKGQWASDMFVKGEPLVVEKGGDVGDIIQVKEKGQVMALHPYDFKVAAYKDGVYLLESANDMFRRGLKVRPKD